MELRRGVLIIASIGIALVIAGAAVHRHTLATSLTRAVFPPQPLVRWDLRHSRRSADIFWPTWATTDLLILDGPQPVEIFLPDGRTMRCTFSIGYIRRENDVIYSILLMSKAETLDEAYAHASRLIGYWAPEKQESLRTWYQQRLRHPPKPTEGAASEFTAGRHWPYGVSVSWAGIENCWTVTWGAAFDKALPVTAPVAPAAAENAPVHPAR